MSTLESDHKLFCLVVSGKKVLGSVFSVLVDQNARISDLKRLAIARTSTLKNAKEDELTIWKPASTLFKEPRLDNIKQTVENMNFDESNTAINKLIESQGVSSCFLNPKTTLVDVIVEYPILQLFCCVVIEQTLPGSVFSVSMNPNDPLNDIKQLVIPKSRVLADAKDDELALWKPKPGVLAKKTYAEIKQYVETIVYVEPNPAIERLLESYTVGSYFPDHHSSNDSIHVIIQYRPPVADADAILTHGSKKRKLDVGDTVLTQQQKFLADREADVEMAKLALSASNAAVMPVFITEQTKYPILNGRPCEYYGIPVGLVHPVFNEFLAAMRSTEYQHAEQEYETVVAFCKASSRLYDLEKDRMSAIRLPLADLLGFKFDNTETSEARSDGVIFERCGTSPACIAVAEIKNEIGTGHSDPYTQGSLAYRKYWRSEIVTHVRKHCHCPSIIIAIAGPWMCVSGGVYLDKAVVQPLTDYIWLGYDYFSNDRIRIVSRLFSAIKSALVSLRSYYKDLGPRLRSPPPPLDFPFPSCFSSRRFTYKSRLVDEYGNKLVYKAQLDGEERMVVVKYAVTYNAAAHQLLAKHGLAPELLYAGTDDPNKASYGGRYMIVMDFVEGDVAKAGSLSESQLAQVKRAINLLHDNGFVLGDLRTPNIMISNGKVMLIDFDWSGKVGMMRYPLDLNRDMIIGWPEGVAPGGVIEKAHDLAMLDRLYQINNPFP